MPPLANSPTEEISDAIFKTDSYPASEQDYYVIFKLGQHSCALSLVNVERVLRMVAITPVPELPNWMPGVINMHGEIVLVVDLCQHFGKASHAILPETRLLIVRSKDQTHNHTLALITDDITGVQEFSPQEISLPADFKEQLTIIDAVIRNEGQLILVLKVEHLLDALPDSFDLDGLIEMLRRAEEAQKEDSAPPPAGDRTLDNGVNPAEKDTENAP